MPRSLFSSPIYFYIIFIVSVNPSKHFKHKIRGEGGLGSVIQGVIAHLFYDVSSSPHFLKFSCLYMFCGLLRKKASYVRWGVLFSVSDGLGPCDSFVTVFALLKLKK
uniref:Secreted protein n=1 Tax=Ascaris lumbricoides TaxID=6252 RepID=A0A0M3HJE9_ASCLU